MTATPHADMVIFTIVSRNYMAQAASLMQSVRAVHPGINRVIVLADERWDFGHLDLAADLLDVDELASDAVANMKLWYDILEFNTAVKPYAFLHLFRQGYGSAIYLDPDILVMRPMTEVLEGLQRHSLVLTPHITRPLPDDGEPSDHAIMKSGVWNCGFIALRNDADGQLLARWWADRLLTHCRSDVTNNLFTDQRWIDLAPCFVSAALLLRHPGYNVAYWNLPHRALVLDDDASWRVDGVPLVFFHFSGFSIDRPARLSRYETRQGRRDDAPLAALCALYCRIVRDNGWEQVRSAPYAFGRFADGRAIERPMRRWLLRALDEKRLNPRRPLHVTANFFDQADEQAAERGIALTRLSYQLWHDRIDLQRAFDLALPGQVVAYREWLAGGEAGRQGVALQSLAAQGELPCDVASHDPMTRSAVRQAPPWRPVAEEAPAHPTAQAARFIAGLVVAQMPDGDVVLDRQAALTWERRDDVVQGFPLRCAEDVRCYVAWAMTQGIVEGAIDPMLLDRDFVGSLAEPTALAALYGDVPVNLLMVLTGSVETGRGALKDFDRFPVERRGRLSHAMWFAFIAPALYRWPEALFAAARDWLRAPSEVSCGGYKVSRAVMAVWELRRDVQGNFPLQSAAGVRAYLRWAAFQGLPELGLYAVELDPGLLGFLAGPAELVDGVSEQVAIAYALRTDLQAAYDVDETAGLAALTRWGETYFPGEYGAMLGLVAKPVPAAPATVHRTLALTGQWSVPSGRGEDVRGTARALLDVGFSDFVIVDRDHGRLVDAWGADLPEGARVAVDINLIHLNANTAYEDWRFLRRMGVAADRTISWWAWELERLPRYWRHAFAFSDEIWASTAFARDAFAREGLRPVTQVPMAVAVPREASSTPDRPLGISREATLFLFAFDYRSYLARKNPEAIIAAFLEAFPTRTSPVNLLIKTQGAAQAPAAARALRTSINDPRVQLWDCTLGRNAMLALVADCDAYVSLHRSEGFGRGPAEAMLLGKPVILTDYSGTRDFADGSCAIPVDCQLVPVAPGQYPGSEDQCWAEPSVSDAARAMRWVVDHPCEAAALGRQARRRIEALYGPDLVGHAILRALGLQERMQWRDQLAKAAAD